MSWPYLSAVISAGVLETLPVGTTKFPFGIRIWGVPPINKTPAVRFTSAHDLKCFYVAVTMEGNEMEMTKDELRKWIRGKVMKNELIMEVVEKCNLLRSLLERRENQAVHLLQLCK